MNNDLVSVIVPAWNAAAHIAESLESVLTQTHANLELIVIDDGSNDQTADIIRAFAARDTRVLVLAMTSNSGGPAAPRNLGMRHAKGEYLAFLDADDIWHPDKLLLQLAVLHKHGLSFVSTEHQAFVGTFAVQMPPHVSALTVEWNSHARLLRKNNVTTSSALMRTSDIGELRFNEAPRYSAIEDYLMWLYLHQQTSFSSAILTNRLVYYRRRSDSLSASKLKMAQKIHMLLREYRIDGKPLGWRRFFYFGTYLFMAMKTRLIRSGT
ncbi:glycosyltransferase family 2 protein [Arenicella xantha]|uniref:Glycosyltransferase involved in cell wall biosynthesis n=1 Tax=Arenicella xantha TaxID=644221 RepID=A0A395JLX6_9GAMM|nr:glycosyltransferase family A protein [Arenicella xantha]RBP51711.1 glycosyltransferase involved in cell wall biosynthesis [Arenicella xantha]